MPPNANNTESKKTEPAAPSMHVNSGYVQGRTFQASDGSSVVGLSIVAVKVKAKGQEKNVLIYAFLDSGSNTSFYTVDLRKLHVKGEKANLSLTTMQTAKKPIQCSAVNLEMSDLNDSITVDQPMVALDPVSQYQPNTYFYFTLN